MVQTETYLAEILKSRASTLGCGREGCYSVTQVSHDVSRVLRITKLEAVEIFARFPLHVCVTAYYAM